MWWRENRSALGRMLRIAAALAAAALTTGCFQPLYGDHTFAGGPALKDVLSSVTIPEVTVSSPNLEARLGVELRNALIFETTGGGYPTGATHRLNVRLNSTRRAVVVDVTTARPDLENYGIDASYQLIDLSNNKVVVNDTTFSRVSYDIPGQQQRFSKQRALRDAENRAIGVVAQQIKARLASYFVAGT
jgi:LPS-assembly lipoprotein